jgi:hypothetical protein
MQLTLFVPGLLLPKQVLSDTVFDLTAPTLSLILGRGRPLAQEPDWLSSAFGLTPPLPAAALRKTATLAAMPAPAEAPVAGIMLCLDPVQLQVSREGVTLADPVLLGLDAREAAALIEAIKPLFAELGELSCSTPACWELHPRRPLALETLPLPEAIGQAVPPGLPGGADGRNLRHLLAEAQTVLHAHAVNRRRDELGKPTVNSLWPWGLGALPTEVRTDFQVVWSKDPVIAGLCTQAGVPCIAPPDGFQPASGRVLAVVDALERPARALDALAWRAALQAIERDWLAPAVAALKSGVCRELRLVGTRVNGAPAAGALALKRMDTWRFWRRSAPLTALADLTEPA